MNELALFSGAGGGILGGHLLGWRTVCAVEWEEYPASVLCARQNDKVLPTFPIWDDVRTFDGRPWRGIVDVISGGFPCQDISVAGRGDGLDGERSGMWKEMARIIGEVRPQFAFVENSPMLVTRGLERVLADLAKMGYDSRWGVISAADIGANHRRERIWIVGKMGNSNNNGQTTAKIGNSLIEGSYGSQTRSQQASESQGSSQQHGEMDNSDSAQLKGNKCSERINKEYAEFGSASWWQTEPNVDRVVDGMAARVDRLKAIGNGQVPLCAATAWEILSK